MRSKEVEEAINKTKQLKQFIKEKGKDFCFYDNENAVIGYECLNVVLNYISEIEKENADAKEYADDVWRKQEELRVKLEEQYINKQVIRDKIEVLRKKQLYEYDNYGYTEDYYRLESMISPLKEILEGE